MVAFKIEIQQKNRAADIKHEKTLLRHKNFTYQMTEVLQKKILTKTK